MKLQRFIYTIVFCLLLASCSSKRVVTTNPNNKKVVVVKEEKQDEPVTVITDEPQKVTTISKHIENLRTQNSRLNKRTLQYIGKFAPIAISEMHRAKIPASITLAQGILESGNGLSDLATRSNNHFGIKCHKGWNGESVEHDDDELGECFRKYDHPDKSYVDHSEFLTGRKRYASLFRLDKNDYVGWARGLRRAGYATDRKYPQKLIGLIERYELYKFDDFSNTFEVTQEEQKPTNTYYKVQQGDTLYSISQRYKTTVEKLKQLNGLKNNNLSIGQRLLVK